MSVIAVVKEGNSVVFGTDSRFVSEDRARIVSDSVEKIHEIAADTFIATSGYAPVCDFQNAKATELGRNTQDIRTLSEALAQASRPTLEQVAAVLAKDIGLHPLIRATIDGEVVLHGAVLVGRSRGELGYIYARSRCVGGRVVTQLEEYFGAARKITITSASDSDCLARFRHDTRLFSDPPVSVVSAILNRQKLDSSAIGGPSQIVQLDSTGSHWIRRLPAATRRATCLEGIATITAAISMTAPTIVVSGTGGAFTVNIDDTNGVLVTSSSGTSVSLANGYVQVSYLSNTASVNATTTGASVGVSGPGHLAEFTASSGGCTAYLDQSPLGSLSASNGSLAVSDGTGGFTAGKLYFREGGAWVLVV